MCGLLQHLYLQFTVSPLPFYWAGALKDQVKTAVNYRFIIHKVHFMSILPLNINFLVVMSSEQGLWGQWIYISLNLSPVTSMKAWRWHSMGWFLHYRDKDAFCNHNWQKLLYLEVESCLIKGKLCCKAEFIISLAILWKGRCDLEVTCYSYS